MSRVGFVLAVLIASAVACRKGIDESWTGDERPDCPVPTPALSPVTDWVTVGGVAVRVHKAVVQSPVVEERAAGNNTKWRERELERPALVVWLQIANRSGAKELQYSGFGRGEAHHEGPKLTDEFGRVYATQSHESETRRLQDRATPHAALTLGGKAVTDVLCFDPPGAATTELTLTLPALTGKGDGLYQFALPAAAWKK